jgi:hypothetical protein
MKHSSSAGDGIAGDDVLSFDEVWARRAFSNLFYWNELDRVDTLQPMNSQGFSLMKCTLVSENLDDYLHSAGIFRDQSGGIASSQCRPHQPRVIAGRSRGNPWRSWPPGANW